MAAAAACVPRSVVVLFGGEAKRENRKGITSLRLFVLVFVRMARRAGILFLFLLDLTTLAMSKINSYMF